MKSLLLLLALSLFCSVGIAQDGQQGKAQRANSVFHVLSDPKLEVAVSEQYRKMTPLLRPSAKTKVTLASIAIGKRGTKRSHSFDLFEVAQDEVRNQFGRLSKQELDILVFYLLSASLERIKAEKKDSLSDMSEMDQLLLQQAMDKKQQFESIFSNMLKTFQQTSSSIIGNIK